MFSRDDYTLMAAQLSNLKGRFIMSINDVPKIREIFRDFNIEPVQTAYCTRKVAQAAQELLIMNY